MGKSMINPSPFPKGIHSLWGKAIFAGWMFLVMFVYLILFGPPEFWLFAERSGFWSMFQAWKSWLEPFFTAYYLSWNGPNDRSLFLHTRVYYDTSRFDWLFNNLLRSGNIIFEIMGISVWSRRKIFCWNHSRDGVYPGPGNFGKHMVTPGIGWTVFTACYSSAFIYFYNRWIVFWAYHSYRIWEAD